MEILSYEFMQNAIYAAVLVSIICGIIGCLIVVNKIVFLAGGIAHAAYGGVGLAFFFGLPVLPSILGFTFSISTILSVATYKQREASDMITGALWAFGMALGIILIDITPGYNVNLMSFLFGSILAVSEADIVLMLILDVIILLLLIIFYKSFLTISYDFEFAKVKGINVGLLYFLMLLMVGFSIVIMIKVVGLILVIALLTIPSYIVGEKANTLGRMMLFSSILSSFFCLSGLYFSYIYNITSGASIIMVAVLSLIIFKFLSVTFQKIKKSLG